MKNSVNFMIELEINKSSRKIKLYECLIKKEKQIKKEFEDILTELKS